MLRRCDLEKLEAALKQDKRWITDNTTELFKWKKWDHRLAYRCRFILKWGIRLDVYFYKIDRTCEELRYYHKLLEKSNTLLSVKKLNAVHATATELNAYGITMKKEFDTFLKTFNK